MTVSADEARRLALALPGAVEADHHGRPSFRVGGKIFATLWDEHHLNVMLDEPGILTAVAANSESCAERWWGKRLSAVEVALERAEAELVADLLADAWEHMASSSEDVRALRLRSAPWEGWRESPSS
jgi:hypothetical protein